MFSSLLDFEKVKRGAAKFQKDPAVMYQYGTAGFRCNNELLDPVMFRMGLLAVMRSKALKGKTIGVMVTASHNPEQDNGVKVVEPLGEMLVQDWELVATDLANVVTDQVSSKCARMFADLKVDHSQQATVIFARDTRSSGMRLCRALVEGIKSLEGSFIDYGELTTPQLHYLVRCLNTRNASVPYGIPTEAGYYEKLTGAFNKITAGSGSSSVVAVDCANGIGALKMQAIIANGYLPNLKINLVNVDVRSSMDLNNKCGADFVKVDQKFPTGFANVPSLQRCASFDGDADRVVYFFADENHRFNLLDGDKIAALIAGFVKELLDGVPDLKSQLSLGIVQTAYANGKSTEYFRSIGIPVVFAETGVKNLHHEAEKFDIGVYFEANGHGTVLFSGKYISLTSKLPETNANAVILKTLPNLINQAVGDAISDFLAVEAILALRRWNLNDWSKRLYTDLPNRQVKVKVNDRRIFKTTDAERKLVSPPGIQSQIDALVARFKNGRAFIRPSGTEDVVRIYAEASTREECDLLADSCKMLLSGF